jgi:ribosomal protein L19
MLSKVEVIKNTPVKRAKLYYTRTLIGKAASRLL